MYLIMVRLKLLVVIFFLPGDDVTSIQPQVVDIIILVVNDPFPQPRGSMYGLFTYYRQYIYYRNRPNVGKYTIHGSFG